VSPFLGSSGLKVLVRAYDVTADAGDSLVCVVSNRWETSGPLKLSGLDTYLPLYRSVAAALG
jgi:anti-anti-sigma regulatory factor